MKYLKSAVGQQAFKTRSTLLSARQRAAFILFDGVKSSAQVLTMTSGLGITQNDIDHMVEQGFLVGVPDAVAASVAKPAHEVDRVDAAATRTPQERYSAAMPIATKLTASLGLRGFRLNLAVEAASGFEDLMALLPKIQAAVGIGPCEALERALKG